MLAATSHVQTARESEYIPALELEWMEIIFSIM